MSFEGIRNRDPYAYSNQRVQERRDPNRELISAVEGRTKIVATGIIGIFNPLAGLLAYNTAPSETQRDIENIDQALRDGANINYQEPHNGYTALIHAGWGGYPNIARHLIQRGANPDVKEDKGFSAYTMAKHYLDRYRNSLRENETRELTKTFTDINRAEMRKYYQEYIDRYQEVVNILSPVTRDQHVPDRRCCCTIL